MRFLSPAQRRTLFVFLPLLLVVPLASQLATAQSSPPIRKAPPPPPPPPATDQEQFVAYWTSETGWNSELQLRNNAVGKTRRSLQFSGYPMGQKPRLRRSPLNPRK
jgi:hypothetical protein